MMMFWSSMMRRLQSWRKPLRYDLMPLVLAPHGGQPAYADALSQWAQWCEQHAGARVKVCVSAHWCLVALAEHPQAVWQQYHGLTEEAIQTEWVVRQLPVGEGRMLACAVPRALMQAIIAHARQHHVQLAWVGPWWMPSLAQSMAQSEPSAKAWVEQEPGLKVCAQFETQPGATHQLHQLWCEALPA